MRLQRGLLYTPERQSLVDSEPRGCVATIGNFDGVHVGHATLLARVRQIAQERQLPSLVILFEPHPQEFFSATPPPRLSTFREKLESLSAAGIDRVLCLRFDAQLAAMPAQTFIDQVLLQSITVKHLIIGDDFCFGHQRRGDFALLQRQVFQVEASASVCLNGERVSSTAVRNALANGELARAGALLGRAYSLSGHVVHGDKRGRQLGFPTANVLLHRKVSPVNGVFAVRVCGVTGDLQKAQFGVANIGIRPTVGGTQARVEAHLFDFGADIYGKRIRVELLHKLRGEQKFDGLAALQKQIALDVEQARDFCSSLAQ